MTRFVVLGGARSGTTMLVEALNSLPGVVCFGEIFNAATPQIEYGVNGWSRSGDLALRARDPARFLRERIFCGHPVGVRAAGFKFHYEHFWRHAGLVDILAADSELRVVHLVRRNMLRAYVSLKLAEASGRWFEYGPEPPLRSRLNVRTLRRAAMDPARAVSALRRWFGIARGGGAPPGPPPPLVLDAQDLAEFCRRRTYSERTWEEILSAHAIHRLSYEGLAEDTDRELAAIAAFLGVEAAPARIALRRQNPGSLRSLIANYDAMRITFAGTALASYFDA